MSSNSSMSSPNRGERVSPARPEAVAEIAGLHGAFSFPERLLQQIWLRGDFDQRALRLRDGRALRIRRRGRWNRLAGPDFADAELELGEGEARETVRGAVEVHLRAVDWETHAHASDPAYAGVVLHVVLFPSMREWTQGASGRRIPILELLPLLERDLEAYAEEAAVEGIAGRPYSQLREALAGTAPDKLRAEVTTHARRRWAAKVALARARIERVGWAEACHQRALEVLGYRANRAPMLAVAERWPLAAWREAARTGEGARVNLVEEALAFQSEAWARAGVRPANQPRGRLAQYAAWVAARPDWTEGLAAWGDAWAGAGAPSAEDGFATRRALTGARRRLAEEVCGSALGGTRFDTWVVDAALPFLAARAAGPAETATARPRTLSDWERLWTEWRAGDLPAELMRLAREFADEGEARAASRQGYLQGLLGWLAALLANDAPRSRG